MAYPRLPIRSQNIQADNTPWFTEWDLSIFLSNNDLGSVNLWYLDLNKNIFKIELALKYLEVEIQC